MRLAEFPTTRAAAEACHAQDIATIMGAPNLVRGGSHSGNVAAKELAELDLLDILSSDYVPAALLLGAVQLGNLWGDMARGLATVTRTPAVYVAPITSSYYEANHCLRSVSSPTRPASATRNTPKSQTSMQRNCSASRETPSAG